jgi:hypothetical protein
LRATRSLMMSPIQNSTIIGHVKAVNQWSVIGPKIRP